MRTVNLRRQHDAALTAVAEMQVHLDRLRDDTDRMTAYAFTMALAKLAGVLRIHLAQEDKVLYPQLMASTIPAVAEMAERFVAEMGQIGAVFMAYATKWRTVEAVLADTAQLRAETAALFAALGDRIHRENTILYPLADNEAADHYGVQIA
jgi:hemerythrin-like domain-containing protein